MRLGNSNGNNRGKKYFIRGKHDILPPSDEHRAKADLFNKWFVRMADNLVNFLKMKECYLEDVFSNTYLRMYEKLLYTGNEIKDYKAYFHRSYYTNYILHKSSEKRYGNPLLYDNRIDNSPNMEELDRKQRALESDIFDYVYTNYDLREFELFKMYMNLKPAINYKTLAEITNIKVYTIQRIISGILSDIRSNQMLVTRYRDIA